MAPGRFRMGMTMIGSFAHTEHEVAPDQPEPDTPASEQPTRHIVDLGLVEWQFDAQIGFARRFAIEAFMPVRVAIIRAGFARNGEPLPGGRSIHHRDETLGGAGDLVLAARVGLVTPQDVKGLTVDARLGTTFPTGGIERDPFALGREGRPHQHIFFGSGTFDPVLGLEGTWARPKRGRKSIPFGITGWTFSRVNAYRNRFGYRPPTTVTAGIGAHSGFGLEKWTFLVQPEVYFETRAQWQGTFAINSGRTSLLATVGAFVRPGGGVQFHALLKIPYFNVSHGGQYRWPLVALLGFTWTIDAARKLDRPVAG